MKFVRNESVEAARVGVKKRSTVRRDKIERKKKKHNIIYTEFLSEYENRIIFFFGELSTTK